MNHFRLKLNPLFSKYNFFAIFTINFTILYILNWNHLYTQVYPTGDIAADMLLTNKIYNGVLLTGHYSRFDFHHPGPFFFYINALFEQLTEPFYPSRYNSWIFGHIVLSSLFITLSTKLILLIFNFHKHTFLYNFIISILLLSFTMKIQNLQGIGNMLWMPNRIILPYLVFILTLPLIARRQYKYLLLAMLFLGILIHGYVTQPVMTIPILGLAFVISLFSQNKKEYPIKYKYIYGALIIGLFFALPMLVDLIANGTYSNFVKIISVFKLKHDHASWLEIYDFYIKYYLVMLSSPLTILLLIGGISFFYIKKSERKLFFLLGFFIIFESIIFILYYHSAPAPLYEFTGRYFIAIPIILYVSVIIIIFKVVNSKIYTIIKLFSILLLSVFVLNSFKVTHSPPQSIEIKKLATKIIEYTNLDNKAYISNGHTFLWPQLTGILLELSHRNYPACTTWMNMSYVFTKKEICNKEMISNILLIPSLECNKKCIFKTSNYGLIIPNYNLQKNKVTNLNDWNGNPPISQPL